MSIIWYWGCKYGGIEGVDSERERVHGGKSFEE